MVLHLHTRLLSFKQSRYNLRSVANNTLARPEIKSAKTTGDRAFAVAASVLSKHYHPILGLLITLLHSRNNKRRTYLGKHIFRYFRFNLFFYLFPYLFDYYYYILHTINFCSLSTVS